MRGRNTCTDAELRLFARRVQTKTAYIYYAEGYFLKRAAFFNEAYALKMI